MPATNELLLEEIRSTQQALSAAQGNGNTPLVVQLTDRLTLLNKRLEASQSTLNESTLLKG